MSQQSKMRIKFFPEPNLVFGAKQPAQDPRDGLILYGPNEPLAPSRVRVGVVGTTQAVGFYKDFVTALRKPIYSTKRKYAVVKSDEIARPSFPGFQAVFGVKWDSKPDIVELLDEKLLNASIREPNVKRRVTGLVNLYLNAIKRATSDEDQQVDIWFVVVPVALYKACRPNSAGRQLGKGTINYVKLTQAGQTTLGFEEENYVEEVQKLLDSSSDFHHVLKASVIHEKINTPLQIALESTLQFRDKNSGKLFDQNIKAHLAWTQSTTLYYKLGRLPWRLSDIREGVCYLGIIFKKLNRDGGDKSVCSAAQMFLTDGDGSVFRGNIGLWETKENEFHLNKDSAEALLGAALDDYFYKWQKYPNEFFIHGRSNFTDDEWKGFCLALAQRKASTQLVGITIKDINALKFYRRVDSQPSNYGVMRGQALIVSDDEAHLFTRGFIPRLNTSTSLEIPNPLQIKINRGEADIEVVIKDILALTKLNYNACIHADGLPVTLRFSNVIGSILTATSTWQASQKQFKYYI